MQPVSNNTIQHQVISTPKRPSGQSDSTLNSGKIPLRKNSITLPEDIVTLSQERSSTLSQKKDPSKPVTAEESMALRESFSVYA